MKRPLRIVLVLTLLLSFGGAARLISQQQAITNASLTGLGFEEVPSTSGLMGAPSEFKVTAKTLKLLEELMKDGRTIKVDATGAFEAAKAK